MSDVDRRILWLAGWLCLPTWRAAFRMASDRTRQVAGFDAVGELEAAGTILERIRIVSGFAQRVRVADPVLSCAFELLALRTTDDQSVIHAAVAGALGVLASADGDTREARARLRVWNDVARHKYDPAAYDDFFALADTYWRSEMQRIVADEEDDSRIVSGTTACVAILEHDRGDDAMEWLRKTTERQVARLGIELPALDGRDRKKQAALIRGFSNVLSAQGRDWTGELALAWQAMLCDPRKPQTFTCVLPQISWILEHRSIITKPPEQRFLRDRLEIWWRAARGEWADSNPPVSVFRIAAVEAGRDYHGMDEGTPPEPPPPTQSAPSVVVMPGKLAEERNMPTAWRDMRDQALPLIVVRDIARIRDTLRAEYPHAWQAVGVLLQDLREGLPVRMRPTLLLGPLGSGKSRVVRRLAELIGGAMYVYRYDDAAAHDGTYAGSPKSWSSAQPRVPARAIMMSRMANPIALVDEIDKGGISTYNGNLWNSMTPFLECETSARYRETGLDAELDLSHVCHLATANSIDRLPAPLRDRYRVIRIPSPTLQHLPALAAAVMRDPAAEDEARSHDQPLADDELAIIGRAWARERFSMRKLQRLIAATLETRDACARRH
ncbi:ATP-dependent Lon protease [Bradyrhizobium sp. AZCC 1678]|uniref:AAA family ATPase n=1 Tax=Bradyrhizobium sp. AZCC 1678 TaxID=3117030 RepID=UPI002FEFA4F6